jgi:PAS domain-containing protein/transcriptional regulator with XRE-family HTH domain
MSMQKLADLAGISRESISIWERGIRIPETKYIRMIASALNIDVSEISNLKPENKKSPIELSETRDIWSHFLNEDNILNGRVDTALNIITALKSELSQVRFILQALISGLNSIMYIKDKNCKYVIANDAFLKNVSLPAKYITLGKDDNDFFSRNEAEANTQEDIQVLSTGNKIVNQQSYIPGTRKKLVCLKSKIPILDAKDNTAGVIALFSDNTQHIENEKQRLLLENVINGIDAYISIIEKVEYPKLDYRMKFVNNLSLEKIYKSNETEFESFNELKKNNDFNALWKKYAQKQKKLFIENVTKAKSFPISYEYQAKEPHSEETKFFSEKIFTPLKNIYFIITHDITKQLKSEGKNLFGNIFANQVPVGLGIIDIHKRKYIYLNDIIQKIYDCPLEILYEKGVDYWLDNFIPLEDREFHKKNYINNNWPKEKEYRIITQKGRVKWVNMKIANLTFMKTEYLVATLEDITEQKNSTEKGILLEKALDGINEAIWISNITDRDNYKFEIQYVNKVFEKWTGYSKEEIYKNPLFRRELLDEATIEKFKENFTKEKKYPIDYYYELTNKNKEKLKINETVYKIGDNYSIGILKPIDSSYIDKDTKSSPLVHKEKLKIAKKMKNKGFDEQVIIDVTELTEKDLKTL